MRKVLIAPSLLSADFSNLEKEVLLAQESGAEFIHFDVMDGHFVPNISFGAPVLKWISKKHNMVNDVHLMISDPKKYAKDFAKAGADYLTFHYEACANDEDIKETIKVIRDLGLKVGISIKPKTDVQVLVPFMNMVDLVLIMSVEPGFGGQSFMENALDKILFLRNYIDSNKLDVLVEVDGGINDETAELCKKAGIDILVAGSYLFGHDDFANRVKGLKK